MSLLRATQGTAKRVPPPGDAVAWGSFSIWLGTAPKPELGEGGAVTLTTAAGRQVANPGDWLVRTYGGELHLGRDA